MRHQSLITAIILSALAPLPLCAQDIFIKPATPANPSQPQVDYGMRPTVPKPVTPQPNPSVPPTTVTPTPAQPSYPIPTPPPGYGVQELPGGSATIVNMPPEPPSSPGAGPNTLNISFQPSVLGANDKSLVMSTLGITEEQINSGCFFRYSAMVGLGGDQNVFVNAGNATSLRYQFAGPLVSVHVFTHLTCRKLRPPVSGIVTQQGDYYVTTLGPVDCQPTSKGSATLAFRYTGDNTGQCAYQ